MSNISTQRKEYSDEIVNLHFNTKKIRAYEPKEVIDLMQKISGLGFLIGLSEPMPDIESQAIVDFWKGEFADISFSEVEKAIKLNSSMKLEKKIEHYNKFSTDFLGSVLFYYRRFRASRLAKYSNSNNPPLEGLNTSESDKIALLLIADTKTLSELNEKFKQGITKGFDKINSVRYFDTLKRMGKMPEYNDKEKWLEIQKQEYNAADTRDIKDGLLIKGKSAHNTALKRYKKHLLERFLNELEKDGIKDLGSSTFTALD